MDLSRWDTAAFFLLLCSLLCSCASVSVKKIELLTARPPTKAPAKILVKPPTFHDPGLRVDRSGAKLETFKYELQEKFTRNLVQRLSKHVSPAQAVAATAPLPRGNYWLITGRFDRVNQGSRLLRSVVGFGAGGTKLDMSVVVYDLSKTTPRPILLIETTGGSNATPGAIGTAAYFVTGVTALFSPWEIFSRARARDSHSTRFGPHAKSLRRCRNFFPNEVLCLQRKPFVPGDSATRRPVYSHLTRARRSGARSRWLLRVRRHSCSRESGFDHSRSLWRVLNGE